MRVLCLSVLVAAGAEAQTFTAGLMQCSGAINNSRHSAKVEYKVRGIQCGTRYCTTTLTLPVIGHAIANSPCDAAVFNTSEVNADAILSGFKVNRGGGVAYPVHGFLAGVAVKSFDPVNAELVVEFEVGMPTSQQNADETTWDIDFEFILTTHVYSRVVAAAPAFSSQSGVSKGVVSLPAGTVPPGWVFGEFSFSKIFVETASPSGIAIESVEFDARDPVKTPANGIQGVVYLRMDDGSHPVLNGAGRVVGVMGDPIAVEPFEHDKLLMAAALTSGVRDTSALHAAYLCGLQHFRLESAAPEEVWSMWGGWETLECGYQPLPLAVYRTPYLLFFAREWLGVGLPPPPSTTPVGTPGSSFTIDQVANGTSFP